MSVSIESVAGYVGGTRGGWYALHIGKHERKKECMRRLRLAVLVAALSALIFSSVALAANPHFVRGPTFSTTSSGALRATGTIAGLGNADVTVSLSAAGSRTCLNRGGNQPPGQTQTVSGSQTITDVKNGRVTFDVTTGSLANTCPDHMKSTVTFTSATLTVTQGGQVVLQESFTP